MATPATVCAIERDQFGSYVGYADPNAAEWHSLDTTIVGIAVQEGQNSKAIMEGRRNGYTRIVVFCAGIAPDTIVVLVERPVRVTIPRLLHNESEAVPQEDAKGQCGGCGSGIILAFLPPVFLKAKTVIKKRIKRSSNR